MHLPARSASFFFISAIASRHLLKLSFIAIKFALNIATASAVFFEKALFSCNRLSSSFAASSSLSVSGLSTIFSTSTSTVCGSAGVAASESLFSSSVSDEIKRKKPLLIILDCSTDDRPGLVYQELKGNKTIVIDHHASGKPFYEQELSYIVPSSPSTTLLVDEVRIALSVELDKETAKYLMLGFLTDTGFFHFISEEQAPDSFKKISSFVETGLNPYELYDKLHDGRRLEDVKSVAKIIEESKAVLSGRVIIAYERKDYAGLERPGDSVYSNLLEVEGVKVVVLIKEREDAVEFGFRAKRDASVDVGKLASELSGGGHKLASGATVKGMKIEDAEPFIISKLEMLVN